MSGYGFTDYFENQVLRKQSYLQKEWCVGVCENPIRMEKQEHNRYRFWAASSNSIIEFFVSSHSRTKKRFTTPSLTGISNRETELRQND